MTATVELALMVLGAYLLGSAPVSYLAVRWSRGIDIRRYGSGNVGASNVLMTTSRWLTAVVTLFDIGKGAVMVWAAGWLGLGVAQQVTVGVAAIAGHNWPVFLGFNGGRGILTSLGVVTALVPWLGPVAVVMAFSPAPFHQLAPGVLVTLVSLPLFSWFLSQPLGVAERLPVTLGFLAVLLIAVFRRLSAPRTSLTDTVGRGERLLNRLLFDRDIRDREAWVRRAPLNTGPAGPGEKAGGDGG
ncbi:MAG: glycerol-3-phosphate acyltransferase [Chloroflexota bacterium]